MLDRLISAIAFGQTSYYYNPKSRQLAAPEVPASHAAAINSCDAVSGIVARGWLTRQPFELRRCVPLVLSHILHYSNSSNG